MIIDAHRVLSRPASPYRLLHGLCAGVVAFALGMTATAGAVPPTRPPLSFRHLTTEDGLPAVEIRAVLQDRAGFMWFGSSDGLVRYDSRELRTFRSNPSDAKTISNNSVWDLAEDRHGNLWIASDGGLDLWRRTTEDAERIALPRPSQGSLTPTEVRKILLDGETGLWLATYGSGLLHYDLHSRTIEAYRTTSPGTGTLSDDTILSMFRDSRGIIWLGTLSGGLNAFDPVSRQFKVFRHDPTNSWSLASNMVSAIGEDNTGRLWAGTSAGASRLSADHRRFEHYRFDPSNPDALQGTRVDAILLDRDGRFWIGTDGGGLSRIETETSTITHYRHVRGDDTTLSSDAIRTIFQDRAGDLWTGHWPAGVGYASRVSSTFALRRTIPGQPGTMPDDNVHALLTDPSGDLWVGTDRAGLCRLSARTGTWTCGLQKPPSPTAPQGHAVLALGRDPRGAIWIGTWSGGAIRLDPATGRTKQYLPDASRPDALSNAYVFAIAADHQGRMWFATNGGGINRYVPETDGFVHYRYDAGNGHSLPGDTIPSLLVTRDGGVWVGAGGIARYNPVRDDWDRFSCSTEHPGSLGKNLVNDLLEGVDGSLWVATAGSGVNRVTLATRTCEVFGTADGLPSGMVRSIINGDDGSFWVSTSEGLVRLDPTTRRVRVFDEDSGIPARGLARGARAHLPNGDVIMGSTNGIVSFNPLKVGAGTAAPPVVLTRLEIFNQAVTPGSPDSPLRESITTTQRLELPSRATMIGLYFAALNFRAPAQSRLAYRLDGFDRDWREAGAEHRAVYTNLAPGSYVFRVRSATDDGLWDEQGIAMPLIIIPAWWQTSWFRSGLGLALAGILIALGVGTTQRRFRRQLAEARREADLAREREHASDAIRTSEERLTMALAGADLGTWDWDVSSGLLVFDTRWASMIGYAVDELRPRFETWHTLVHPEDLVPTTAHLEAHLAGQTPQYESEFRMRHKDGHWVWVLDRGRVIQRTADGQPLRMSGTHLNITTSKAAQAEQQRLQDLLIQSQKLESVGRLAGGVAHDLNNMLTPIIGHGELLAEDLPAGDPRRKNVTEIIRAAERSRDLVGQLLAFARKQTLALRLLDLNQVVRDLSEMLRRTLREDIVIDYTLAEDLPGIRGDLVQLQQVILNLAVNAQDAMPEGGRLSIETTVRAVATDGSQMDPAPKGVYVVLEVRDTGTGMDIETRSRVFEPFFTTKGQGRGTGLGLSTVYGIVKQHGGYIHVYSEPGEGTTFRVCVAAQSAAAAPTPAAVGTRTPLATRGTEAILLVEDQPQVRDLCTVLLTRNGYRVLAAETMEEALTRAAEAGPIDLLLTDVVLPDKNGRALFDALVAIRPGLRVIYMSGYTANVITDHGVLDEGLNFIQKPFNGDALLKKVRDVLDTTPSS